MTSPADATLESLADSTGRGRAFLVGVIVAISAAAAISSLSYQFSVTPSDETVLAWLGKRVAGGDVPYRDFFTFLPPALTLTAALPAFLAGPGLGPLRLLTLLLMVGATVAVFHLALQRGARPLWAAAAALWLPMLLLPFWPVTSHQWLAVTTALCGFALLIRTRPSRLTASLGGILIAWSVMTDQLVAAVVLVAFVTVLTAMPRLRGVRRAAAGAFVATGAGVLLWLIAHRAVSAAFQDVVVWPLRYYKQPGGYNDSALDWVLAVPGTRLSATLPIGDGLAGAALAVMVLLVGPLLVLEGVQRWSMTADRRARLFDVLLLAAAAGGFLAGRPDLPHVAFWSPAALLIAARMSNSYVPRAAAVCRVIVAAGLAVGVLRFGVLWASEPPDPRRIAVVDPAMSRYVHAAVLDVLPDAARDSLPVAVLSDAASTIYLYWSPDPPPVDWVMAPSGRVNSTDHYALLSEFVEAHRIPFLLLPRPYLDEFRAVDTPLRSVVMRFTEIGDTPFGVAMRRH